MLQVARECSGRDPSSAPTADLLSFGELCLFTGELKKCYHNQVPRPPALSNKNSESSHQTRKAEKNMSLFQYQVFLGGSCNPTTWRQDIAIPLLNSRKISYYNPQVSDWEEGLVELEYQAKQSASILFFVLDSSTRNVASMGEIGYMAGRDRKLVLVLGSYEGPGQLINGEPMSQTEYEELSVGLLMTQDLVERQRIPVFSQVNHALNCTVKMLRENLRPQELSQSDKVQPVKFPHVQLGHKLVKIHDAFVNLDSNEIELSKANILFKLVTNRDFSKEELQTIIQSKKNSSNSKEITLNFKEFCCIVAEFENSSLENRRNWDHVIESLITPMQKIFEWALPRHPNKSSNMYCLAAHDVYLGGSQGDWREAMAIPLLRKHGLSYFSPSTVGGDRLHPMEAAHIDKSRVLLFVITDDTRSVCQMALAAYYIGQDCNVVLCVQTLADGTVINNEQLTPAAIKDYNRGRCYLRDQANKDRIPVFSNIEEAVECSIQKSKAIR